MISKGLLRTVKSLDKRKYRILKRMFVAEGTKVVDELLGAFQPRCLIATKEWYAGRQGVLPSGTECETVTQEELQRISLQQHPQEVVALFELPHYDARIADVAQRELVIALDNVQDPGNLGTIVRLADWFGIGHVFCSVGSADVFNPKAVQATMGALARVQVYYTDLVAALSDFSGNVYGTMLNGVNIYDEPLAKEGVIVMGNEGNGISAELERLVTTPLFIPPYPRGRDTVESLNVAMATAIVCSEFRRRR